MFGFNFSGKKSGVRVVDEVYYFGESPNLDCNSYVIRDPETGSLTLVDAGNGLNLGKLLAAMREKELDPAKIENVVITHVHIDHLLGLYPVYEQAKEKPNIYALGDSVRVIREGDVDSIFPPGLGITPRMFNANIFEIPGVKEVKDGDHITLGQLEFEVLDTPGHCPGSLCLYEGDRKILLTGDVVFTSGSFGRVDFPGGSAEKLLDSIGRLSGLDVQYLLPGHMDFSEDGNRQIKIALMFAKQVL
ncbi:MAG: MBL fold metallo-hydrolase [Promethearchaeota archaeon]